MKAVTFFKQTSLFVLALLASLTLSQCGGNGGDEDNNTQEEIETASEQEAMYPEEKLQQNTNLTDNDPLELQGADFLDKKILLATLNRQKTLVGYEIEKLTNASGTAQGNLQQLRNTQQQLDQVITQVRAATEGNFGSIENRAQDAIESAGNLIQSNRIQAQQGF